MILLRLSQSCFLSTIFILILFQLCTFSCTNVSPFDPSTISLFFKNQRPAIFLLTSSQKTISNDDDHASKQNDRDPILQFHKAAGMYYQKYPHNQTDEGNLLFILSDPNDGLFTYQRLADFLGVYPQDIPAVIYLSEHRHNTKYKYDHKYKIKAQSIINFLENCKSEQYPQFYKTQPLSVLAEGDGKFVKMISGSSFKSIVLESDKQFFIIFYAPWDYKSRVLKVQFQKAAQSLRKNKNIIFGKVNSLTNELAESYLTDPPIKTSIRLSPNNLPVIMFWKKDKKVKPIEYSILHGSQKVYDFMLKWLEKNTEYDWIGGQKVSEYVNQQL